MLSYSILLSFIIKSFIQGTQSHELEDRNRNQNKPPIIQVEKVSNLLLLDYICGWNPHEVREGVGRSAHQDTFHHLS